MKKSRKKKSKKLNGFQRKQKLQQELRPKPISREIDVFIQGEGRSEAFTFSVEDLKIIISEIVDKNSKIIEEREMRSMGPLMGEVMEKVRGKIDGEIVSKELKVQILNKLKEMN